MVILPSTNTRDASKGIQMHFLETQLILWHHGNNIHVEKQFINSNVRFLFPNNTMEIYFV